MSLLQKENINKQLKDSKVSIVIATYRRDKSLEKAIQSVIGQSYDEIEIIVIDDNAERKWNEKVQKVISKLSLSHPIVYIQNKENKGSAETRNIGIQVATGEFITFLDDDDIYLPDKVKNQVQWMIKDNADYCITDLALYDENERFIEKRTRKYIKEKTKEALFRYHLMYHITGTDTLMFKKEYLLLIGGFPPINVGDEFYLMQRAIEAGGIFSYLPSCDVQAYVHTKTDGLSSGTSKIKGENELYKYKKRYFSRLKSRDVKYIKMRHFAVLAFATIRNKDMSGFIKYSICSFISSPGQCVKLILLMKKA